MIYRLFLAFLLSCLGVGIVASCCLYLFSYEEISSVLFHYVQNWITEERFKTEIFRVSVFERSKGILLILTIILAAVAASGFVYKKYIQAYLDFCTAVCMRFWRQVMELFTERYFLLFMLTVATAKLILLSVAPFHVDEYASFVLYVSKGPLIILSNYDVPNNHVLYNLMAWLLQFIFTPFWAMKLPAFMASVMTCTLVFWYAKKHLPLMHAWLTLVLLTMSSAFIVYGLFGRGHIFAILFFVALQISYIEFFRERRYLIFIAVFTALGIACVPYFMLPSIVSGCVALAYMGVTKRMSRFPSLAVAAILSLVLVFIFYSPAIAFKGIDSLYRHSWAQPVPFLEYLYGFPLFVQDVADTMISIEPVSAYVLVLIQTLFFMLSGKESWNVLRPLMILAMVLTVILALMYHTPLFARIWLFTLPVLAFQVGYIFCRLYSHSKAAFICLFIITAGYSAYAAYNGIAALKGYYTPMCEMVEMALDQKEDSLFIADDTYYMYAKYLIQEKHLQTHIFYSAAGEGIRIIPVDDTADKNTDSLLIANRYMMLVRNKE